MKKFLLVDNGSSFNLQTPWIEPLGGSETSLLLLAHGLEQQGHQVVILSSTTNSPETRGAIRLDNIQNFVGYADIADIIILNRCIPDAVIHNRYKQNGKPVYYYSHDAYDQQIVQPISDPRVRDLFSKILCVSEWQKETFINYFGCKEGELYVLGNSVDSSLYYGYSERNEKRLIFASIPYKGLDVLPGIFDEVCKEVKDDDIQLDIYSSMSLYGNPEGDSDYAEAFRKLRVSKGVNLYNPISMTQMAKELASSSIMVLPNTYHETFSMLCTMAQSAGCIPIAVNNGAMGERIVHDKTGYLTSGKNILNDKTKEEFIGLIIEALGVNLYGMRVGCQKEGRKFDYCNITNKLISIVESS